MSLIWLFFMARIRCGQDIRDLFNLTTSHMSTYMVVGTLFLGFSVSFIWNCPRFPGDPPWLKLFWVNTFIAAMCYGFLAVWLAMHGAIAAQSASVQLLTRAIRPPYPSASELQRAQYELSQYEAAPNQFFTPPNLLGSKDAVQSQGASHTSGLELPSLPASMPQAHSLLQDVVKRNILSLSLSVQMLILVDCKYIASAILRCYRPHRPLVPRQKALQFRLLCLPEQRSSKSDKVAV